MSLSIEISPEGEIRKVPKNKPASARISRAEALLVGYWKIGIDDENHGFSDMHACWQQIAAWCHGSMAYARERREYAAAALFEDARELAHALAKVSP